MRRALVVAVATAVVFSVMGVAGAFTPGKPEIDRAAARFDGQATPKVSRCVGEDGDAYVQYDGRWAGTMTDTSPVPGDFSVTGALTTTMSIVQNAKSGAGEAEGTVTLQGAAGGGKTLQGRITLVTQRTPDLIQGRGMIVANALDASGPTGDRLVANVEVSINRATFQMTGQLGGAASWDDFSIKDNNQSCV
jgi:hypothetical protein